MTIDVLPQITSVFLLIFARLGAMIMLIPGFSNSSINVRARLTLALVVTFVFFPILQGNFATLPTQLLPLIALVLREALIGLAIGASAAFIMATTQIAGTIIATQIGLAYSQTFDPSQGVQGVILGSFMSTVAVVAIFTADLHHLSLGALYYSYELFDPGVVPTASDMVQLVLRLITEAMVVATQMSAPFLAFGLIFYLGIGVLSRLMPQVQIFFVAMPLNITIGLLLFGLLFATMMTWYLTHMRDMFGLLMVN